MEENVSRERKKLNRLKFYPKGDKIVSEPKKQEALRIWSMQKITSKK
jgi:hypothetical protein